MLVFAIHSCRAARDYWWGFRDKIFFEVILQKNILSLISPLEGGEAARQKLKALQN